MLLICAALFLFSVIGYLSVGFSNKFNGHFYLAPSHPFFKTFVKLYSPLILVYRFRGSELTKAHLHFFRKEIKPVRPSTSSVRLSTSLAWLNTSLAWLSTSLAWLSTSLARLNTSLAWLNTSLAWLSTSLAWLNTSLAWLSTYSACSKSSLAGSRNYHKILIDSTLLLKMYNLTNTNHTVCILNGMRT